MALEWFDAFDQYGPTAARLLDGVYAEMEGVTLSTANPRTGVRHLRVNAMQNDAGVRRVLSAPRASFGLGYAFRISELPTDASSFALLQGRNSLNNPVFTITVGPSGDIYVRNGGRNGTPLQHYPNPAIFANAYQHFEAKFDDGFKVRINEVQLIDTLANPTGIAGSNVITSVKVGNGGFPLMGAQLTWDIDDLFCYNTEGDVNNDFIGDCKVYERFGNQDLSPQDWDISEGSDAFEMLNNVPPLDDAEYLLANGVSLPKRALFGLPDLPLEIVEVRGVMLSTRAFKTDAGTARLVSGVLSDDVEENGAERAISMAPIWFNDVFDKDPKTDALWTLSGANDLKPFIDRVEPA